MQKKLSSVRSGDGGLRRGKGEAAGGRQVQQPRARTGRQQSHGALELRCPRGWWRHRKDPQTDQPGLIKSPPTPRSSEAPSGGPSTSSYQHWQAPTMCQRQHQTSGIWRHCPCPRVAPSLTVKTKLKISRCKSLCERMRSSVARQWRWLHNNGSANTLKNCTLNHG